MSRRDPAVLLADIVDYANIALTLSQGRTRADLDSDSGLRLALERALEIVGEAASHLPSDFRAANPAVP